MNKRLLKRHKRQVARAKDRGSLSQPDLRTPEQVAAARESSRAVTGPRTARRAFYSTPAPERASPAPSETVNSENGQ